MPKNLLFAIILIVILVSACTIYVVNNGGFNPGRKDTLDAAINQAKYLYRLKKEEGTDFSKGPCLTNALMSGWVLDIVHNPKEQVDDLVENQCSSYINGQAKHFVELDINGSLVRAR